MSDDKIYGAARGTPSILSKCKVVKFHYCSSDK